MQLTSTKEMHKQILLVGEGDINGIVQNTEISQY